MTLARALGVAASDLYHQAWRLVILNTLLGLALVLVVLAKSLRHGFPPKDCERHRNHLHGSGGPSSRRFVGDHHRYLCC